MVYMTLMNSFFVVLGRLICLAGYNSVFSFKLQSIPHERRGKHITLIKKSLPLTCQSHTPNSLLS